MTETTRVLIEGTIKYLGSEKGDGSCDWMTARVFVLDWQPPSYDSNGQATVIAREPIYLPHYRPGPPSPAGSIHRVPVYDPSEYDEQYSYEGQGYLLTVEAEPVA